MKKLQNSRKGKSPWFQKAYMKALNSKEHAVFQSKTRPWEKISSLSQNSPQQYTYHVSFHKNKSFERCLKAEKLRS